MPSLEGLSTPTMRTMSLPTGLRRCTRRLCRCRTCTSVWCCCTWSCAFGRADRPSQRVSGFAGAKSWVAFSRSHRRRRGSQRADPGDWTDPSRRRQLLAKAMGILVVVTFFGPSPSSFCLGSESLIARGPSAGHRGQERVLNQCMPCTPLALATLGEAPRAAPRTGTPEETTWGPCACMAGNAGVRLPLLSGTSARRRSHRRHGIPNRAATNSPPENGRETPATASKTGSI